MVTKEQLRDWLDTNTRKERVEAIERSLDALIKRNALAGETSFYLSTGETDNYARRHRKSTFYNTWHNKDLSEESQRAIKREVLRKYKDAGFVIEVVSVDHGWDSSYEAVQFKDIHKLIEGDDGG